MDLTQPKPIQKLISQIAHRLCDKYCDEPLCTQYAWWALESITQKGKTTLLLEQTIILNESQQHKLNSWIKQQVEENIPLQYLIGSVPFANCTILVEPPILIPRQETEEWCIALIKQLEALSHKTLRILDIGTGSGCIAIALAKALPQTHITATDISDQALDLAQKNAELNAVSNITFFSSDLFSEIPDKMQFDLIISNPPYISMENWKELDSSVKNWEDNNALIAPENGVGILKEIIQQASGYLDPHKELTQKNVPHLIVEIGYTQGDKVKSLFSHIGFSNVAIKKDLHGNDRLVSGSIDARKKP